MCAKNVYICLIVCTVHLFCSDILIFKIDFDSISNDWRKLKYPDFVTKGSFFLSMKFLGEFFCCLVEAIYLCSSIKQHFYSPGIQVHFYTP